MIVPGSNILNMALRLVAPQTLEHEVFTSRAENIYGDTVSVFAAPVAITGSFQPVSKDAYQELGLNLAKNYSTLYTPADVKTTTRDVEGDRIIFGGKKWMCESDQDWYGVDGWHRILCVEIP